LSFGELDAKGRLKDRVEILSDGCQFVAHGTHPKTLLPYVCARPLVPRDQLAVFSPAQVVAFLEELRSMLPAKPLITEGATTNVNQASLKGPIDMGRQGHGSAYSGLRLCWKSNIDAFQIAPAKPSWQQYDRANNAELSKNAVPRHPEKYVPDGRPINPNSPPQQRGSIPMSRLQTDA
jgi:hypothetical protein